MDERKLRDDLYGLQLGLAVRERHGDEEITLKVGPMLDLVNRIRTALSSDRETGEDEFAEMAFGEAVRHTMEAFGPPDRRGASKRCRRCGRDDPPVKHDMHGASCGICGGKIDASIDRGDPPEEGRESDDNKCPRCGGYLRLTNSTLYTERPCRCRFELATPVPPEREPEPVAWIQRSALERFERDGYQEAPVWNFDDHGAPQMVPLFRHPPREPEGGHKVCTCDWIEWPEKGHMELRPGPRDPDCQLHGRHTEPASDSEEG